MTQVMYDDVTLDLIPPNPHAVLAYDYGPFKNIDEARQKFPKAIIRSCATQLEADGDFGDFERYDMTNEQSKIWVPRQIERIKKRGPVPGEMDKPGCYSSVSNYMALLGQLAQIGVKRSDIIVFTAHYGRGPHICNPSCGFGFDTTADLTQYTDTADNRSLDESLCMDWALGQPPKNLDPHHYAWFDRTERDFNGTKCNEHDAVMNYDRRRHSAVPNDPHIVVIREHLGLLAGRLVTVMHEQLVDGKVDGQLYRRQWRHDQLKLRADGHRIV